jgi:hypothetical protein
MIIIELLNAVSMIAPFVAWLRNRKNKRNGTLHKFLPTQLIVSSSYHLCSAFLIKPKLVRALRCLDIFSIHMCSLLCCIDGLRVINSKKRQKVVRITCLYSSLPLLVFDMIFNVILKNKVIFGIRLALICQNNLYYIYVLPFKDNAILIMSSATSVYFYRNTNRGLSHTYFHLSLFTLFDEYFERLNKIEENLKNENKKLIEYKECNDHQDAEISITIHDIQ